MTDNLIKFTKIFSKKNIILFSLFFLAICLVIFLFLFFSSPKEPVEIENQESAITENQRTGEVLPIVSGERTYAVHTGDPTNPQIMQVKVDTLDLKIGETQTITVQVKDTDNEPITSKNKVNVTYYTDNGSTTIPLLLKRVDGPPILTTWQGIWECGDTHDYIFEASVFAASEFGESFVDLSFR